MASDQALATALLMIVILAVNDEKNVNIESGARPLYVGLGLVAIRLGESGPLNVSKEFTQPLHLFLGLLLMLDAQLSIR